MEKFVNDKASKEFIESLKESTQIGYANSWAKFLEFTGLTGDHILESRKIDKEFYWERKVLEFRSWMEKQVSRVYNKPYGGKTASAYANVARAFFSHNRLPLKFIKSEAQRMKEGRPRFEDYRFTVDEIKRMAYVANVQEKYVVTAGKSFGLRASDFMPLTRGQLEPYINREPPIFIGELVTQKEGVEAFPFIDSDAQPVIKAMFEKMNAEGRTDPTERMLKFTHERQLTRILTRLAKRSGINTGNKRIRFHCLRKFLCDRLASSMSESKWKQIVGKKISESAYVSPDSLRDDYAKAMMDTTFTKPEEMSEIAKLEILRAKARELGISEKRIQEKRNSAEIQAMIEAERAKGDCPDGVHCQKICIEDELADLLANGWHVITALPSGRIIVQR
jgi:integrase